MDFHRRCPSCLTIRWELNNSAGLLSPQLEQHRVQHQLAYNLAWVRIWLHRSQRLLLLDGVLVLGHAHAHGHQPGQLVLAHKLLQGESVIA